MQDRAGNHHRRAVLKQIPSSVHLNDADPGELAHWSARSSNKIKAGPRITDVANDPLNAGPNAPKIHDTSAESPRGYAILPYHDQTNTLDDAFGQRIVRHS